MRILMTMLFFLIMLITTLCTPPVSVGTLPSEIDIQLKKLSPPMDKALIYVIRPEQIIRNHKIQITCDSEFIGYTLGGTYLAFLTDPGLHILTSEDSVRIVDNFDAFYKKRKANTFRLLPGGGGKEDEEKQTQDHILFIKKHNYIMKCLRSQNCNVNDMNRILKDKPMPLEMYLAISVQGGETYFLIQSFKSGWDHPQYLLNDCDTNVGWDFLKKLRHTRYVNPDVFPKSYIKFPQQ
ncbi:hypothetical protein JW835_13125 [bacterium]|nr:hypothetical protein [bacterium]